MTYATRPASGRDRSGPTPSLAVAGAPAGRRPREDRPAAITTVAPAPASWIRPRVRSWGPGFRAVVADGLNLVCGAGPFELELHVRETPFPHRVLVTGQVTRAGQVHDPVAGLDLALVDTTGSAVLAATRTDPFGEFSLASDRPGFHGLRCGAAVDAPCVLVWDGEETR